MLEKINRNPAGVKLEKWVGWKSQCAGQGQVGKMK